MDSKNVIAEFESIISPANSPIIIAGQIFSIKIEDKGLCVSCIATTGLPVDRSEATTDSIVSGLYEDESRTFFEYFLNECLFGPAITRALEDVDESEVALARREVKQNLQSLVLGHDWRPVLGQLIDWVKVILKILLFLDFSFLLKSNNFIL